MQKHAETAVCVCNFWAIALAGPGCGCGFGALAMREGGRERAKGIAGYFSV